MKISLRITLLKEFSGWLLSLIVLIPVYLAVMTSLKSNLEASKFNLQLPKVFMWHNYAQVIEEGSLIRYFFNSMIISTGTTVLCLIVSALAAFVLARNTHGMNNAIYNYFLVGLIAPINIVSTIKVMQTLHIMNSTQGIIILYTALSIPFSIFLYYGFIKGVPRELDEAGIIDGCNGFQLFAKVIFPLLKPVTITVAIINFLNSWNDFILPLYLLNRSSQRTMVMGVYYFYGTFISNWNLVFAVIVLAILPIMIVYILGQKYIISGMTAGAVKG
ncbi:carbohydrate ABC transporter permease [Paenibacillus psychroresistens]|uniref:Carbohydrate ABC transporter permease n=1 Tax=Paenibacillus psychroresistens TaxID=1778678 RepID=A0A6B8RU87_9BACL|nr:carbohydrate ABC transporter permease [Paenibacillus psychroresistens]QGQ99409.1 carbohydrate ABC transporter permease [Paenibacillus psychroresistens]